MSSVICDKPYSSSDKWTASIMLGLLFLLVSSPFMYGLTNKITSAVGFQISDAQGCPNLAGMILHTLVFIIVLRLMLNKDQKNGCLRPYSSRDKWTVSMMGGLLFILVSSPVLYDMVNSLTTALKIDITEKAGCPNMKGLILHTAVYIVIARLLMR